MGIKLPFPSLKGKTGGVKKSKWGSTLGSMCKVCMRKEFSFQRHSDVVDDDDCDGKSLM